MWRAFEFQSDDLLPATASKKVVRNLCSSQGSPESEYLSWCPWRSGTTPIHLELGCETL